MCSAFVCLHVVCVPDMLTPFVFRVDDAGMCELEPCLTCQSDKELVRGVVTESHESAPEPLRHPRRPVSRLCAEASECAFCSGIVVVSSRGFHLRVHMEPVGASLLWNSGGRAISTAFAEDGVGPGTCHFSVTDVRAPVCL